MFIGNYQENLDLEIKCEKLIKGELFWNISFTFFTRKS